MNLNGLDNRRCNLRVCTDFENKGNRAVKPHGKSLYKGVFAHSRPGKWQAKIKKEGAVHHLGTFTDPESAARAYNEAASELFGEFARLNEI